MEAASHSIICCGRPTRGTHCIHCKMHCLVYDAHCHYSAISQYYRCTLRRHEMEAAMKCNGGCTKLQDTELCIHRFLTSTGIHSNRRCTNTMRHHRSIMKDTEQHELVSKCKISVMCTCAAHFRNYQNSETLKKKATDFV